MDQYRDPYRNLKAQEDEITKIMAIINIIYIFINYE